MSRDDDTGKVKLRLSSVNGDRLYAEFGGPATPASMQLDEPIFETEVMRVSFLAADSSGEHETGEPVEWSNRITLESRDYLDGDERRVEIQAAPPAAVRYATGGCARLGGGACERESIRGGRMKAALDDPAVLQRVLQGGRPPAEWTKGEPGRRLDGPVVRRRGCSQARLDLDAGGDRFHRRPPGPGFGGRVPYCCATTHGDGLALLTVRPR